MTDNDVKTISIPIDEYFDLRTKAEMNAYLIEKMGQFDERLYEIDCRVYNLTEKIKEVVGESK